MENATMDALFGGSRISGNFHIINIIQHYIHTIIIHPNIYPTEIYSIVNQVLLQVSTKAQAHIACHIRVADVRGPRGRCLISRFPMDFSHGFCHQTIGWFSHGFPKDFPRILLDFAIIYWVVPGHLPLNPLSLAQLFERISRRPVLQNVFHRISHDCAIYKSYQIISNHCS